MADYGLPRIEITNQAVGLRAELKVWEKDFASSHGGKKAGREDIKQNPEIGRWNIFSGELRLDGHKERKVDLISLLPAAKYKEYSRLKSLEASLARRENRKHEAPDSQSKKRKHTSPTGPPSTYPDSTPRKSSKGLFATPSNNRTTKAHPSQLDPYDTPSTFRKLFSPSTHRQSLPASTPLKAAIGPTPQRDGKALGLFDMLSESGGSNATPTVKKQKDALTADFQTPSKPKIFEPIAEAPEEEEHGRLSRTPASSAKQFYLANLFATPTTMRYAAMVEAEDEAAVRANTSQAPPPAASPEKNPSRTPSFLRRSNSGRFPPPMNLDESAGLSPIASRKPLHFPGRGLSRLVQGLRAMEEEREDDDWDVLREIEAEQEAANVEVPDSQFHHEQGRRPYKKKGQKRTTRRVIMRPVAPRPKPRLNPNPAPTIQDHPDYESEDELSAVPETQFAADTTETAYNSHGIHKDDDEVASLHTISEAESSSEAEPDVDSEDDPEHDAKPKQLPRARSFSERIKEAVSMVKPKLKDPPTKPIQVPQEEEEKAPKVRKVNPHAHANYRSLKIRNKSGGSRGRGRFRRR